jgi:threonine dehydrogenase-like Zn-dependent dehydrogenase
VSDGLTLEQIVCLDPGHFALAAVRDANYILDPKACDIGLEIKKATGKKRVDVSIEASGNYAALQEAVRSVHYCGLVVTVSFYHGEGTALRLGEEWHHTRVTVRSSMPVWGNPSRDYPMWDDERLEQTVLDLMTSGELKTKEIVSPIFPFERAIEAYRLITEHPESFIKLGLTFQETS